MFLVAICSLCPLLVFADVPDEGPDSFGIYFEVGGEHVNELFGVAPNQLVSQYVILAGISRSSIGGWEVAFDFTPGSGLLISTTLTGSATNSVTPPNFLVGLSTPLLVPAEGYLILAEMNILFVGGVLEWIGGPVDPSSIPGVPAYSNGEDSNDLVPCHFSTDLDGLFIDDNGWTTVPLAVINQDGPVGAESLTWESLKTMFR